MHNLLCMHAKSLQSCLTLCDPMDYCSPPSSSVHGILQARILVWVAMRSSRGSSQPRYWVHISRHLLHWQADSLPLVPPQKPSQSLRYQEWLQKNKSVILYSYHTMTTRKTQIQIKQMQVSDTLGLHFLIVGLIL